MFATFHHHFLNSMLLLVFIPLYLIMIPDSVCLTLTNSSAADLLEIEQIRDFIVGNNHEKQNFTKENMHIQY